MFIGGVVGDKVNDDVQAKAMGFRQHCVKVVEVPEQGVDAAVVCQSQPAPACGNR